MSLPAVFDETLFELAPLPASFPSAFAIVTGYATMGEVWSDEANAAADAALADQIAAAGWAAHRVTGWAPLPSGAVHAEPGWAVGCTRAAGIALGAAFRQVAVWWVSGDALECVACEGTERRMLPGGFRSRWRFR